MGHDGHPKLWGPVISFLCLHKELFVAHSHSIRFYIQCMKCCFDPRIAVGVIHTFHFLAGAHHAPHVWGKMGTLLGHDGQIYVDISEGW